MLRIGLTGGIGSGKSVVAKIFGVMGIPVYYADLAARRLMEEDLVLVNRIKASFGEAIYTDGKLNRSLLGSQVFNDPEKLALLNSIVHPSTLQDAAAWMDRQTTPYAIKEAAIIFEAALQTHFDFVIGVTAPDALRIARVMARDGIPEQKVRERMRNQWSQEDKMARCDFIITNDEQQAVLPQVLEIHRQLLISASQARS